MKPILVWIKSNLTIIAIGLIIFFVGDRHLQYKQWEKSEAVINNDVISYYAYLPAFFIEDDIKLSFIEKENNKFSDLYWPISGPNNSNVVKTSAGLSLLYLPFFLSADLYSSKYIEGRRGNEPPYKVALILSSFVFLIVGLIFTRKTLLLYFDELSAALTIIILGLGTNLWYYSIEECTMSHVYSFSLIALYSYGVFSKKFETKNFLYHGILIGLISLVRPTNVLVFLLFLFFQVNSMESALARLKRLFRLNYIFLFTIGFFLIWSIQFSYWKYVTDQWLYFPYTNEKFFFLNPEIWNGLVGFRKGWFVYTPLMLLCIPGFFILFRKNEDLKINILIFWIISIYIMFSWWAWWYGGGFGMRPLVDYYSVLSIPLASVLFEILKRKNIWLTTTLGVVLWSGIWLNRFQTQQYRWQIIHYDGMNWEGYKHAWMRTEYDIKILELIERPDYEKAKKESD